MNFKELEFGTIFLYILIHNSDEEEFSIGRKVSATKIIDLHRHFTTIPEDCLSPGREQWDYSYAEECKHFKILKILENEEYALNDFKEEFPEYFI